MAEAVAASSSASPGAGERPQPLAQNRDFVVVLGTQGVSALGDAAHFTAMPLLVLALTGAWPLVLVWLLAGAAYLGWTARR